MSNSENTSVLVVIVHGFAQKAKDYESIEKAIKEEIPNANIILPNLPLELFSTANLNDVVIELLRRIDEAWGKITSQSKQGRIILIGHSSGALVARKVYITACGENADSPFEPGLDKGTRSWAPAVERIVLFAGISRGWTINTHMNFRRLVRIRLGIAIGRVMEFFGRTPIIFRLKRGASFVTQVRIQWLSMLQHVEAKGLGGALVVQLLGTVDDLISPQEVIDLVTGSNFCYLDIPNSDHVNVLDFQDPSAGPGRRTAFISALTKSKAELELIQVTPDDDSMIRTDNEVTDVVFVIHGIRDTGYWTQKLARRVKAKGDKAQIVVNGNIRKRKFAMETSTYGYFAMLPFVLYSTRRAKVEWLMDQYVENKARYPNAVFSFVGHSNGTYLLAKALHEYPACTFANVVFAGSVVSSDYDWRAKRVGKLFNFVATSDLVVAIFPASFQKFRKLGLGRDITIGGGGFEGFTKISEEEQLLYVDGGHGAAIDERYWDKIADFIVNGTTPAEGLAVTRPARMKFFGRIGAFLFITLASIVLSICAVIILLPIEPVTKVVSIFVYGLLLRFVVTKF